MTHCLYNDGYNKKTIIVVVVVARTTAAGKNGHMLFPIRVEHATCDSVWIADAQNILYWIKESIFLSDDQENVQQAEYDQVPVVVAVVLFAFIIYYPSR